MEKLKDIKYLIALNVIFIVVCIISCCVIINNKSNKCDCSKCEITNNEVISDNTDNTQVTENDNENEKTNSVEKYDNFRHFSCIEKNENYCLFKNDDDLKIEIEVNSVLNYTVIINGNKFIPDFDYLSYLDDIQVLYDGYVYVQYGEQGIGPLEKAFILDSNANVITRTTDIDYIIDGIDHADIKFEDNKLYLTNIIFGGGGLSVICTSEKKPSNNANVYINYKYEYIGNGKISEVSHTSSNFSEYLQAHTGYSTCEEYLNNR